MRTHIDEPTSASGQRRLGRRLEMLRYDPGILRFLRALAIVGMVFTLVMTFLLVIVRAISPLADPDTWWHLVMGHKYLEGASIRHPGAMSQFGTEDWHSRDWSIQILAALFEDWFGLAGVAGLFGLGLVVLVIAMYRLCRARATHLAAILATAVGVLGAMSSLTPRPQVVSFILIVVLVGALLRTVDDLRPRWWLAALTGVWACVHGMWFLSPATQAVIILGLLMDHRLSARLSLRHIGLLVLSLVAVAVTPNGVNLLRAPLGPSDPGLAGYIQETQPPSFQSLYYAVTLAMFGVVVIAWARGAVRVDWTRLLLLVLAVLLAVQSLRTVAVGAVLVVALFAESLDAWIRKVPLDVPRGLERAFVYGGSFAAVIAISFAVPFTADAPDHDFDIAFSARIEALPNDAVVLNELGDGGYLAWRYPDLRITLDGLSDQYSLNYLADAFGAARLEPGWEDFVQSTGASYALLAEDSVLATALELSGWTEVAVDTERVLLARP